MSLERTVEFAGLALETAPGAVMTPQPRSEELVERAIARVPAGGMVVDVGTGSGAVAIALSAARPDVRVWATDVSPDAVSLARRNAARHGVDDRVHVALGDLLAPVEDMPDVIVANLPYLPLAARAGRPELAGEPHGALFVPGEPLAGIRRLLRDAATRLAAGGDAIVQLPEGVLEVPRRGAFLSATALATGAVGSDLLAA